MSFAAILLASIIPLAGAGSAGPPPPSQDAMTQILAPLVPGQVKFITAANLRNACYENVTSAPDYNATVANNIRAASGCFSSLSIEQGMVYDTIRNRFIVGPQGGHQEYYGNELYALSLNTVDPNHWWDRITTPDDTAEMSLPTWSTSTWSGGEFPTGNPVSTHMYGGAVFIPTMGVKGTLMNFNSGASFNSVGCPGTTDPNPVAGALNNSRTWCQNAQQFYDFAFEKPLPDLSACPTVTNPTAITPAIWPCNNGAGVNAARAGGSGWFTIFITSTPVVGFIANSQAVYDPVSNKAYRTFSGTAQGSNTGQWITGFDPVTGTFFKPPATGGDFNPGGGLLLNRSMVADLWGNHQQWWAFGGRGSNTTADMGVGVVNLPNGDSHEITPNTGACPGVNCYPNQASDLGGCDVGYYPPKDQMMIWCGGQTIYMFNPATIGPTARMFTAITLTGDALPPAPIGSASASGARGGYNRIKYDLVHGEVVIVYGTDNTVFVFKVPDFT